MNTIERYLEQKPYPGRGLFFGLHADNERAVIAYFIMGRSENSRNRVFVADGEGIRTEAYDPALITDPSLIIYAPVKVLGRDTIVSNGDQTESIYQALSEGSSFEAALSNRRYEPDSPNYTPRVSGLLHRGEDSFSYILSILKRGGNDTCQRFYYNYAETARGCGHLIHTYAGYSGPQPSFSGEPPAFPVEGDIDEFTSRLWQALNADNRVSLFVRFLRLDGECQSRIINQREGR